jgi:glutathione peroxidase
MNIYEFKANTIDGEEVSLEAYKGKVLVIVNTASKCGFTPQYEELQRIYDEYNSQGLEILGFPCNQFGGQEPENNSGVKNFCEINYGVNFPLFEKTEVRGKDASDLFKYLTENAPFKGFDMELPSSRMLHSFLSDKFPEFLIDNSIKWNFTKFLIDKEGNVVKRFESTTEPADMVLDINTLLRK